MEAGAALRLWGWLCARVTNSVFRNGAIPTVDAFAINAETGTIEPGKSADFIVINQNLLDIPPQDIHQTKVLRTVLKGKTVYSE
jgi:imidazolonepropionase-like amidohydrolase